MRTARAGMHGHRMVHGPCGMANANGNRHDAGLHSIVLKILCADACNHAAGDIWSAALSDRSGRVAVRRVIASDNSCLFNAVGYVMERSREAAPELRY